MTNAGRIAALIEDVAELMAWAEKLGYVPKKSPVETGPVVALPRAGGKRHSGSSAREQ